MKTRFSKRWGKKTYLWRFSGREKTCSFYQTFLIDAAFFSIVKLTKFRFFFSLLLLWDLKENKRMVLWKIEVQLVFTASKLISKSDNMLVIYFENAYAFMVGWIGEMLWILYVFCEMYFLCNHFRLERILTGDMHSGLKQFWCFHLLFWVLWSNLCSWKVDLLRMSCMGSSIFVVL